MMVYDDDYGDNFYAQDDGDNDSDGDNVDSEDCDNY